MLTPQELHNHINVCTRMMDKYGNLVRSFVGLKYEAMGRLGESGANNPEANVNNQLLVNLYVLLISFTNDFKTLLPAEPAPIVQQQRP